MSEREHQEKVRQALAAKRGRPMTKEELAKATGLTTAECDSAGSKLNYRGEAYIYLRGNGGYIHKD